SLPGLDRPHRSSGRRPRATPVHDPRAALPARRRHPGPVRARPADDDRRRAPQESVRRRGRRAAMTIVKAGPLGEPAERSLAAVARRGHDVFVSPDALPACEDELTLAVSDGPYVLDLAKIATQLVGRRFRVLVLSRLGAHPDARTPTLQRLWRLEEH